MFTLATSFMTIVNGPGGVWGLIKWVFYAIFLLIDSLVYWVVDLAYQLFMSLARIRFLDNSILQDFASRLYIVIGVASLFLVAYALILAIINPDNVSKGNMSLGKIIPNIAIAIVGIAVVPSIFNYAYVAQDFLVGGVLQKIFLQDSSGYSDDMCQNQDMYTYGGRLTAELLFETFFYVKGDFANDSARADAAKNIMTDDGTEPSLYDAYADVRCNADNVNYFQFSNYLNSSIDTPDHPGTIGYMFLISTAAGAFLVYVLINLCFDLGVRAVKLAYLQMLAPLPILTIILPGTKKVFSNWLKKTTSCFLEVFTRLVTILFVIYIIQHLSLSSDMWTGDAPSFFIQLLTRAFLIIGLFGFLKKAPKLLTDILGIDSGGFKLGIQDKLAENGVFQVAGAAGGGITSAVRNFAATPGGIGSKALSAVGGLAGGSRRGWTGAKDAKTFSATAKAAGKAANDSSVARMNRRDYRDAHGGKWYSGIQGHASDMVDNVKEWPKDYAGQYAHYQAQKKKIDETKAAKKAVDDRAAAIMNDKDKKIVPVGMEEYGTLYQARLAAKQEEDNALHHDFEKDFAPIDENQIKNSAEYVAKNSQAYKNAKTVDEQNSIINDTFNSMMAKQREVRSNNIKQAKIDAFARARDISNRLADSEKATKAQIIGEGGFDGNIDQELLTNIKGLKTSVDANKDVLIANATTPEERAAVNNVANISIEDFDSDLASVLTTVKDNSKSLGDAAKNGSASVAGKMNEIAESQRAREEKK